MPNLSRRRGALTRCNRGGWLLWYLAPLARPAVAEDGRLADEGKGNGSKGLEVWGHLGSKAEVVVGSRVCDSLRKARRMSY